jgi:hypothetical protein
MSEPQDFESLDELFRKTFDRLPENAADNGWDKPSDRVWQHIQATVQPPHSGWSAKAITMVSALAVSIVVGLYLFVGRADQPVQTTTPAPAELPVVVTAPPMVAPETVTAAPVTVPATRPARVRSMNAPHTVAPPVVVTPQIPEERPTGISQRSTGSLPLPGSQDVPPNTTVLNLDRLWATPLEPLPVLPKRVDSRDEQ